jgi:hypothetical protein
VDNNIVKLSKWSKEISYRTSSILLIDLISLLISCIVRCKTLLILLVWKEKCLHNKIKNMSKTTNSSVRSNPF